MWMAFGTKFFARIFFYLTSLRDGAPNAAIRACPLGTGTARLKPNLSIYLHYPGVEKDSDLQTIADGETQIV